MDHPADLQMLVTAKWANSRTYVTWDQKKLGEMRGSEWGMFYANLVIQLWKV